MAKINTINLTSPSYSAERETVENKLNEIVGFLNDKAAIRDDTGIEAEPKQMENVLDMNSNEIANLPYPDTDLEPVRKTDLTGLVGNILPDERVISDVTAFDGLLLDTGTANAYVLNPPPGILSITALSDGMRFRFIPANTCTGASTITFAGVTKTAVGQDGLALESGEVRSTRECLIQWDALGDRWIVRNSGEEWRAIPLSAGWQIYGFPWEEPEVCKIGSMVFLRGLTRNGTTSDGTVIGTLPVNFRPVERLMFTGLHSTSASHRLDVAPTGELLITGVTSNAYLSLSNTSFSVK